MEKYFLGLDIGTDSIGFAVTDTAYNVIKKGKKDFIGTRLFESGQTAEERRGFRSTRHRAQRNKQRIALLRELFSEEIFKIDKDFFLRLDESMYHLEDKSNFEKHNLFNDKNYTDKEHYKKYKTIYHLRKALINKEVSDPRLLYLGLAHIIKNRGHFLYEGNDFGEINDFSIAYNSFDTYLSEENYAKFRLEIDDAKELEKIIKNRANGINNNEREIYKLMPQKPTSEQKTIIQLILGKSVKLSKLFNEDEIEEVADKSVCFKKDYEKFVDEIACKLDDKIILIEMAKCIYDWSVLVDILDCPNKKEQQITISDAKIYKYQTHFEELKLLKAIVKKYIPNEYKEIFANPNLKNNYPAYIGMTKKSGAKLVLKEKVCSVEDFSLYLTNKFKNIDFETEEEINLIKKIDDKLAFPKLRTKENSVIPYQVNKKELDLILENNKDIFPFLKNSDGENSIADKIKSIFIFRIPYYVGPLNSHSNNAWIIKNLEEKILPWNFKKVVNLEESAEQFIIRMTNKCTYLRDKDVVPKQSLLYSKFTLLNELNKVKLDGQPISIELKQDLYNNLFKKNKKVTMNKFKTYLVKNSFAPKDVEVTGIDGDFKGSLESYIAFSNIFGEDFDEQMAEDIIKWITLFSDDKSMLKNKIQSKYNISKEKLNKIITMKFSGWGRFSREFLTEIEAIDVNTGEVLNIIETMYNTNLNLMEVLSNDRGYIEKINSFKKKKQDITLDDIKELYCSPAVKKSIWQVVQIVKEVEKIMGDKPEKLFIEMTRAEGEKTPTSSRKRDLINKYNFIKKEYHELLEQLEGKSESELRQKKLFLYFSQLGKCAYTGKTIDIEDLGSDLYDIEHIYPRSKTKDDSIHNNLVLVHKVANEKKSDKYPIPDEYRQELLWKLLLEKELINKEKFNRLMRKTEFEPKELEGFIARQLVETSQSSKAVAELFKAYYDGGKTKICYVKAGNVSDFRNHFKIRKVREINDYHHAHDAYLNIIVGNVWDTKFTNQFFKQSSKYSLKPEILYPTKREKFGHYAWEPTDNGTIKTVKNSIDNSKILFTRHVFKASGTLFDQTIYKKGSGEFAVKNPTSEENPYSKLTDLSKYGGFKSIKGAYFCVVEHTLKKKVVRTIEYVPIYLAKQIENDKTMLLKYLIEKLELSEPKIILEQLKIGALLNVDGFPMHISGRTGNQIVFKGAVQLKLSNVDIKYFKSVSKFVERLKTNPNIKINSINGITEDLNLKYYDLFADKLKNSIYRIRLGAQGDTLINKRENFIKLSLEDKSKVLINILTIFKCNPAKADLSLIGAGSAVGTILISKKISDKKSVKLINQSITGMYENTIDLLK